MLKQTWHSFNTKFQTQWKDRESSYHVRIILGHFCRSVALILGLNSVKDLRVTKNVKEIKFEGVWGDLESKKVSRDMLQNFILPFMLLLTTKFVKNDHI